MRKPGATEEETGNARQTSLMATITHFIKHCVPGTGDTAMNNQIKGLKSLPSSILPLPQMERDIPTQN